ncbi:hypothetical protein PU630_07765 [Microbacterium horticulturae]|uniref:Uncharacterized protein n=1 Tax=Microbacterium horticulturae TaxID=3028316 RepID=A0ABY8C744_9MICO|nr:hypothetical protein [Microbacterium sp. KACC 23027]WEG10428.1 hypothetical protein PU630_07765 [Microbacterium sp. KACC 23027]
MNVTMIRDRIDAIDTAEQHLAAERNTLVTELAEALTTSGLEVVTLHASPRRRTLNGDKIVEGTRCEILEHVHVTPTGGLRMFTVFTDRGAAAGHGIRHIRFSGDDYLTIYRGNFAVEACSADGVVVYSREPDDAEEEVAHRKSLSRLRTYARSQGMRVQVRDRDVALVAPTNDVVHQGDVLSGFMWLLGIDLPIESLEVRS